VAHRRELRVVGLVAVLVLCFAGAAFAVTSALGGGSANTNSPAAASGSEAWLGISVATSASGGAMVSDVVPGSPAYWAGMETGDVITQINGKPVYKPSDVTSAIADKHPGDEIKIRFQGSGTVYTKRIALATPPAGHP
jgi:putative serine protease PepD